MSTCFIPREEDCHFCIFESTWRQSLKYANIHEKINVVENLVHICNQDSCADLGRKKGAKANQTDIEYQLFLNEVSKSPQKHAWVIACFKMRQIIGGVNTVTDKEKTSVYSFKMCRSSVITLYEVLYIYIYINTVIAKNIRTLGKYDQRRLWKFICIVKPFDFLF